MAGEPANTPPRQPKNNGFLILWVSIVILFLLIFALPTVILLVCGMLPALVAFVIDRQPDRSATFCVASMNFCGVFPYMLDMWIDGHSLNATIYILTSPFALFIMFGAAAFGWVIFATVPSSISSFMEVIAQHRVSALQSEQKKLIAEWGKEVDDKTGSSIDAYVESRLPADKPANRNAPVRTRTASTPPASSGDAAKATPPA